MHPPAVVPTRAPSKMAVRDTGPSWPRLKGVAGWALAQSVITPGTTFRGDLEPANGFLTLKIAQSRVRTFHLIRKRVGLPTRGRRCSPPRRPSCLVDLRTCRCMCPTQIRGHAGGVRCALSQSAATTLRFAPSPIWAEVPKCKGTANERARF